MKLVFGLSIGFQNGMSWHQNSKTSSGPGPWEWAFSRPGAHGAGSPNQQFNFFAEQTLKIPLNFIQRIKSYSILLPDRQMHILHPYMQG